jgi:uncharacterized iron-regulated membrane protein
MASSRARRLWLDVHLYVGLVVGGLFALLGLSGSVLVFYLGVDEALNPATQVSRAALDAPSPDAVLARVQTLYPEHDGPWRIEMPLAADDALRVRYYNPPETAGRGFAPLMLSLDPHSLQVTSGRLWGDYAVTWLYDLHYTLLLGKTGTTLVGIAGLVLLLSLFSGLYLWWPSRARLWAALRPVLRRGAVRKTYDLHVLSGAYGFVVLAVLALTGSVLALPNEAAGVVQAFSPLRPSFRAVARLPEEAGAAPIPLAEAVRIARGRFPGAELRWIETPGHAGKPIAVRFHQAFEPGRRFPRSQVWVHPFSGVILAVRDPLENSGGDTFMDWMHPLHNGEALGFGGRLLVCAAGLLPALAFVTGWLRWRHKQAARKASASRLKAGSSPG